MNRITLEKIDHATFSPKNVDSEDVKCQKITFKSRKYMDDINSPLPVCKRETMEINLNDQQQMSSLISPKKSNRGVPEEFELQIDRKESTVELLLSQKEDDKKNQESNTINFMESPNIRRRIKKNGRISPGKLSQLVLNKQVLKDKNLNKASKLGHLTLYETQNNGLSIDNWTHNSLVSPTHLDQNTQVDAVNQQKMHHTMRQKVLLQYPKKQMQIYSHVQPLEIDIFENQVANESINQYVSATTMMQSRGNRYKSQLSHEYNI